MTDVTILDTPTTDRYANILDEVATHLAAADFDAAAAAIEPIVDDRWTGHVAVTRSTDRSEREHTARDVSDKTRAAVFIRDGFRCTYCGGRAVPRSVLVAISEVFPRFGYDLHYRHSEMHPTFWALAPEADHTVAHSRGGAGALENLTTLHAICNTTKSDALVHELAVTERAAVHAGWNGLTSRYAAIVEAGNTHGARRARLSYHPTWLRRFGQTPLGPVFDPIPQDFCGGRTTRAAHAEPVPVRGEDEHADRDDL